MANVFFLYLKTQIIKVLNTISEGIAVNYLVWSGLVDGLVDHSETSEHHSSIHFYESFRWSALRISIIMKPLFLAVCVSQLCGRE